MDISNIKIIRVHECSQISARVRTNKYVNKDWEIKFQFNNTILEEELNQLADPFVAALLLPSMILNEPLKVYGTVSSGFLNSMSKIQDIYSQWVNNAKKIKIEADTIVEILTEGKSVGCCFSGGVDSFYSYLKNKEDITHLILIRGFDRALRNESIYERAKENITGFASEEQKQCLEVWTNIREFIDPIADWGMYHGSVLAAVGHFCRRKFGRIYIPSSYTYQQLHPWGSHPLLDPLWSDKNIQFIHDGCGTNRVEKVRAISETKSALDSLRVCWQTHGDYNCGRCEKCIRTMLALSVFDTLERCTTFAHPLELRYIKRLKLRKHGQIEFAKENLEAFERKKDKSHMDREITKVLKRLIRHGELRLHLKTIRNSLKKQLARNKKWVQKDTEKTL